jgi:SAM-dependent methyltransferase
VSGRDLRAYTRAVTFDVTADAYDRFMGRFSGPLADLSVDFAGVAPGHHALDVGCGPGALTARLVARLGAGAVAAVDPSSSFVDAARARFPGVDVRLGHAEDLPFPDGSFDVAIAQLVVQFMSDPVAGLREMARVVRPGGTLAATVWDHAGGTGPLSPFWRAVHDVDPAAEDEAGLPGTRRGHLAELFESAALSDVGSKILTVRLRFGTFEEWWHPFTLGVGPAGGYVDRLDQQRRDALAARCAELLGPAPFEIGASAWAVRATAG